MATTNHSQGTYLQTTTASTPNAKSVLIYFITGNPGYIGYYDTFLNHLSILLSTPSSPTHKITFTLLGRSLLGFEPTPSNIQNGPYDFPDVIDHTYNDVISQFQNDKKYDALILIGHSVGSYIALEVLSRLRRCPSPFPSTSAILLFPTVTHIAHSPSGRLLTPLFAIPAFPSLIHYLSQYGFWALSDSVLLWAVKRITGMPDDAAAVTAGFLRGKTGVKQSLWMARDEMGTITEDRWEEEIWGAEGGREGKDQGEVEIEGEDEQKEKKEVQEAPRLVFLFGEDDHWVADHTRDALMKTRGGTGDRVKMVLDKDGIPHGFCIRHSEVVAEKVRTWVEEMVESSGEQKV